jgi:hypothetical protein
MTNKEIIAKADMTLADLAAGGQMNPEQANKFVEIMQATPTLFNQARVEILGASQRKIDKIGFNSRILRAGVEGTPLSDADRSKASTGQILLDPKEVIAEVFISDDVIENNIAREALPDLIMKQMAERAALDIEELVINGDTSSSDTFLKLFDGILKQANLHVEDFASAALSRDAFKKAYKATPAKYIRNPRDWRFFTSHHVELEWRDLVVSRQTNLGDVALEGGQVTAYGVSVQGVSNMQPYSDGGTPEKMVSDILFTHPKNIIIALSRDIRVEYERDIRRRGFTIVLTAKVDSKFEEADAVAKTKKVLA